MPDSVPKKILGCAIVHGDVGNDYMPKVQQLSISICKSGSPQGKTEFISNADFFHAVYQSPLFVVCMHCILLTIMAFHCHVQNIWNAGMR